MKTLQSIGAVVAGLIFIVASHSAVDFIFESTGIFTPPDRGFHTTWMVVTATVYRAILSAIGSFLTALLAPSQPMKHAVILGLIGLAVGTAAAIIVIPMNISPAWYPIALAILAVPSAWIGGLVAERRQQNHS